MKLALISAMMLLLLACGGESESAEEISDSTEVIVLDDLTDYTDDYVVDDTEVTAEDLYSTLEDYAYLVSRDMLISEFGEENLVHGESWYAEGTVRKEHTVLTNPWNGHVIRFLWEDDGNSLNSIEAGYYIFDEDYEIVGRQEVYSDCGVYTGMPLGELREWNGQDFDFFGFGWDYAGAIVAEEGTRLSEGPVRMNLALYPEIEDPDEYPGLWGDMQLNTSDDVVQGAPIVIGTLIYYADED